MGQKVTKTAEEVDREREVEREAAIRHLEVHLRATFRTAEREAEVAKKEAEAATREVELWRLGNLQI